MIVELEEYTACSECTKEASKALITMPILVGKPTYEYLCTNCCAGKVAKLSHGNKGFSVLIIVSKWSKKW